MFRTPVLLLIFNRPETTKLVFEKIKIVKPKFLFVAADGPRNDHPEDRVLCEQTKSVVLDIDWDCELKTLFRDVNMGCGAAPADAISWFFNHVEEGIIIEDDIITDESFFFFCEKMLDMYRHQEKIMHISGSYFLDDLAPFTSASYYFTKHIHVWGWATWRRAWKYYDYDMKQFQQSGLNKKMEIYFGAYSIFWREVFQRMMHKGNDIWDYQWMFAIFNRGGCAINPTANLTKNIGFDQNATHTTDSNSIFTTINIKPLSIISPPIETEINSENDILYYKYFLDFDLQAELNKRNTLWKLKRVFRKLKGKFQNLLK